MMAAKIWKQLSVLPVKYCDVFIDNEWHIFIQDKVVLFSGIAL